MLAKFGSSGGRTCLWFCSNWWFLTNFWNGDHSIFSLNYVVNTLISWVLEGFNHWPYWPNFSPLVARRWLHLVASEHYLEYRSFISLHIFGLWTSWTSLQEWFDFWPCWPNCATWWWKRGTVGVFRPLAWILITQPLHMWCMHWLGESSELILFLVFVKFQPSAGRKMAIHIYFSSRCCPCPILWVWHHSWWFTIFWQILDWFLQNLQDLWI